VSEGEALAERLEALATTVAQLQSRVEALETRSGVAVAAVPAAPQAAPEPLAVEDLELPPAGHLLALLGRACLILGGAYFIRTFTDSGQLPRLPGALLGLAYAALWGGLGLRAPRPADAATYTLVSVTIAYPLLWEATTSFHVFSALPAAAIFTLATCLLMTVAWRRSLHVAAWGIALVATGSGLALAAATHALELFTLVFLGLGGASLWLTYGRRWHGLRWPAALAANGLVAVLTSLLTWTGGTPEAYRELSSGRGMALCLGLLAVYLGSFAVRMIQLYRPINAFEILQTLAVLLLGFGGAVRIAHATHAGLAALGLAILLAGAACYAVAFHFVEDRTEVKANFLFFTTLALAFTLTGGFILLPSLVLAPALASLGLVLVGLGLRFGRTTLLFHATVYLAVAAFTSGSLSQAHQAFLGTGPLQHPTGAGIFTLAALIAAHLWQVLRRGPGPLPGPLPWHLRLPSFACGALALAGLGGTVIWLGGRWLGHGMPEAGALAALRTGVLALSIVGLAYLGRRLPASECAWLVYPLLAATALKLLFEDLGAGRPVTLFIAFTCYGAALILAPRLLRTDSAEPES
jgi:hypothetical protein